MVTREAEETSWRYCKYCMIRTYQIKDKGGWICPDCEKRKLKEAELSATINTNL
jgi:hypothetical protein